MMAKRVHIDSATRGPAEHPVLRAWSALCGKPGQAVQVEALKETWGIVGVCRLVNAGANGSAVVAKLCDSANAPIERAVYEDVLPWVSGPKLQYYGSVVEGYGEQACEWLFIEDAGPSSFSSHEAEHRRLAGEWIARLHLAPFAGPAAQLPSSRPDRYRTHLRSAREILLQNLPSLRRIEEDTEGVEALISLCGEIDSRWWRVEALCERLPTVLVHGDLAEKNARVRTEAGRDTLFAFDWECAGWGVPAVDLAQFTVGSLSPDLDTYWSFVRRAWPGLRRSDVNQMAAAGKIFRLLAGLHWNIEGLNCGLADERWTEEPLRSAEVYRAGLLAALEASPWVD